VVSFERMASILEIDVENHVAVVQPAAPACPVRHPSPAPAD
jgi:FAD/FMN-containing dehydrogenase